VHSFFADLMKASERPAICQRIKAVRTQRMADWDLEHPGERGNPYTQEQVAQRIGITLGAYGQFERTREPNLARLRQIAVALFLDEDYFLPSGDLTAATARVEAEADRLRRQGDEFEQLLATLRGLVPTDQSSPSEHEHPS
jgi:transcriptional regulator with XRE-family HTH domain